MDSPPAWIVWVAARKGEIAMWGELFSCEPARCAIETQRHSAQLVAAGEFPQPLGGRSPSLVDERSQEH